MKVLITGADGQLGRALEATVPPETESLALTRGELDITDADAVAALVSDYRPQWILNAAAYTAVDRAEKECRPAFAVNRDGVANLARAARMVNSWMAHVSTDYVFDGHGHRPYRPSDEPNPINVYGESKLAGELRLRELLPGRHAIVRTSWLYALPGRNFVATMLRLLAEKAEVRVVSDQIGSPTAASGLAEVLWRLVERRRLGTFHWSDAGVASWYDFAMGIREEGVDRGVLSAPAHVVPVSSAEFPTPARRPSYSVLDSLQTARTLGLAPVHWRTRLAKALGTMSHGAVRL